MRGWEGTSEGGRGCVSGRVDRGGAFRMLGAGAGGSSRP